MELRVHSGRNAGTHPGAAAHASGRIADRDAQQGNDWAEPNWLVTALARRPFGVRQVLVENDSLAVSQQEFTALRFACLTQFSRPATSLDCPGQVLVVPPLAGGFPVLMRDLLVGLLGHWSHVAITEWLDARYVPLEHGRFDLAENVRHTIAMIDRCGEGVHVLAICQATVVALAATAVIAAAGGRTPQSLILVGGPIAPLAHPTRLVRIARSLPIERLNDKLERVPQGFPGEGRLVYPASLQRWILAAYAWRHFVSGGELFQKFLADDGDDPEHFPFAGLLFSLMDIPGEHFRDTIEHLYQRCDALSGGLRIGSHVVDPRAIADTALMTIEGAEDDIAGPGQTEPAHALCDSIPERRRQRLLVKGCGHFSLFHGTIMRSRILPHLCRFVRHNMTTAA